MIFGRLMAVARTRSGLQLALRHYQKTTIAGHVQS